MTNCYGFSIELCNRSPLHLLKKINDQSAIGGWPFFCENPLPKNQPHPNETFHHSTSSRHWLQAFPCFHPTVFLLEGPYRTAKHHSAHSHVFSASEHSQNHAIQTLCASCSISSCKLPHQAPPAAQDATIDSLEILLSPWKNSGLCYYWKLECFISTKDSCAWQRLGQRSSVHF